MDNVDEKFASVVDYGEISMRVAEDELDQVRTRQGLRFYSRKSHTINRTALRTTR